MGNKKNENIILTHKEWRQMKKYYGINNKLFKIEKNNIEKSIRGKRIMKIFEDNGNIRLQLMDLGKGIILFDFTIEKEAFEELKGHIVQHLKDYIVK